MSQGSDDPAAVPEGGLGDTGEVTDRDGLFEGQDLIHGLRIPVIAGHPGHDRSDGVGGVQAALEGQPRLGLGLLQLGGT